MPGRTPTPGLCAFCSEQVTKQGFARHLARCDGYQGALEGAERSRRKPESLIRLRVQGAHDTRYWLDLEMRGSATLLDLDHYLRAIWLECCGHLSEFSIGAWRGDDIPMGWRVARVLEPGVWLTHMYDFGTTSETHVKATDVRDGKPLTAHPITLLARNVMPASPCMECDAPATHLCMECIIEHDRSGALCDAHVQTHPHDEYGEPSPLVNSPRTGMCGYDGPALAPY